MPSHDENFKNLIQEYPRQSLAFFAPSECADLPADAKIEFLREQQPSPELGKGFRILDAPMRVTFPSGEREQFAVALEEETEPRHFSIRRLARYTLDLSESAGSDRIVPVVVFLRGGSVQSQLTIGTERETFLSFRYLGFRLSETPAARYLDSDNIVARVNLPNMAHPREQHVELCLKAFEGLTQLEPNPHKRRKFAGFVSSYCGFTPPERVEFREKYDPGKDDEVMSDLFEDLARDQLEPIRGEIEALGQAKGKADSILQVLLTRGIRVSPKQRAEVMACTETKQLDRWLRRAVTAKAAGDLFSTKPVKH